MFYFCLILFFYNFRQISCAISISSSLIECNPERMFTMVCYGRIFTASNDDPNGQRCPLESMFDYENRFCIFFNIPMII